jgi:HEPN domain-containing protein
MDPTQKAHTEHAKINLFAIRCLRDTGDADYIAARLAMRTRLAGPFLWSAEQAVEKYLKCILVLNRKKTGDLGHNLREALDRINGTLPFEIGLNKEEQSVFDHIADWNADRYLIASFHLFDREVLQLDMLVWKLRQYCTPLDVLNHTDAPSKKVLFDNVSRIETILNGPAKAGYIASGLLEKILAAKDHPAHDALVWRNLRYNMVARKNISFVNDAFQAVNAPLWNNPELAQEAAKWMKIPNEIISAAQALVTKRKEGAKAEKAQEAKEAKEAARMAECGRE